MCSVLPNVITGNSSSEYEAAAARQASAMGASNIRGAENAKKAYSRINLLTGQRKLLNIFCQALSHGKYGPVRLLRCLAPFSTLGLGLPKFALL
jgi:hypothetical protein